VTQQNMAAAQPLAELLRLLWNHISRRRRSQFLLLLCLMVLASFAEIFSIGAVLPFLVVLTTPQRLFEHHFVASILQAFGFTSPEGLLLPLTLMFVFFALGATGSRLLMYWASTKYSYATGADLSIEMYERTLYQPYAVHVARHSSEVVTSIVKRTDVVTIIILMCLNLIGSGIILFTILLVLLWIDPVIALLSFGGFGAIYVVIIRLVRKRLDANSQRIAQESSQVIKALQEGLGGIRDVLIDGTQPTYCRKYRSADLPMRKAQASNAFIGFSPRYFMEALGMVLIAGLAYTLSQRPSGVSDAIPILGALALGAQRLLPLLQQVYLAWTTILGGKASLRAALDLLDQPMPEHAGHKDETPMAFEREIRLHRLSFRYSPTTPQVLDGIDLTIDKGSRVGFIGATGSGKSTLLDVVMALLQPSGGTLEIDGVPVTAANSRAWQQHIAHVPQAIFLVDASIEENIAFGITPDKIDRERVRRAAQQAQIADFVESLPQKYKTFVGERGVRLSGGQRQRIGIARALYKQAKLIIFDEATSALDNETEEAVMQAIDGLSAELTVLTIAHRLSTLKNCTQIVELLDGRVHRVCSYSDIEEK